MRRGFTIVELVITITIMGILLTIAVVNLSSTQVNARDSERKGDVESLALNLETYYSNGDTSIWLSGSASYLWSEYMNDDDIKDFLPDLDPKSARAPGVAIDAPISVVPATNADTTTTGVRPLPSRSNDVYVYQPLTAAGTLCTYPNGSTGDCRRFNIYYYQEEDNTVQMVTSKRQS